MNIAQLEYLVAISQTSSFAQASKQLYVSSQAISKAMRELEKEFEVCLTEKTGRGITPTRFCFELAERAESVLQALSDFEAFAKMHHSQSPAEGTLSIGIATSHYRGDPLPLDLFDRFSETASGIETSIMMHSAETCLSMLRSGIVDVALVLGEVVDADFVSRKIAFARIVAMVQNESPLAANRSVTLSDLKDAHIATPADIRFLYPLLARLLANSAPGVEFVPISPTASAHLAFLDKGGVVLALPNAPLFVLDDDLTSLEIESDRLNHLPVCFVTRKPNDNAAATALYEYLASAL